MSLLTLCQSVVDQTGVGDTPATIIGNTDNLAIQLLAWAKQEVELLAKSFPWQAITAEQTITTANGTPSYALPTDYDRYTSRTFWDATNYWPMRGSLDPVTWQAMKRGIVAGATSRKSYRVKGSLVFIFPTPSAIDTLIGEYITNKPVAAAGVPKATFTLDTDTVLIPEHLVKLGVKWRALRQKGFDYSEEKAEYDREVMLAQAQDAPGPMINFSMPAPRDMTPPFLVNLPQQI